MADPREPYMGGSIGQGYGGTGYAPAPTGNAVYSLSPPPPSPQSQSVTSPPRMGSITQFATPPVAQQQQAQLQAQQQQQQQQQQHGQQQQIQHPAPAPAGSYAARSEASFAARSAVAHASVPAATASAVSSSATATPTTPNAASSGTFHTTAAPESAAAQAHQTRMLTDATRKVQEHAYYMKLAMDKDELPNVLDRAALMLGELGASPDHHHHHHSYKTTPLTPKNYYELHLRTLDDMPNLEEYFCSTSDTPFVYNAVQYCPKVLPRLYLQICAASALLRTQQAGAQWVLHDLTEAVKCVQNPVRGLFLRHFLLQVLRDKLPDGVTTSSTTVVATAETHEGEDDTTAAAAVADVEPLAQGTATETKNPTPSLGKENVDKMAPGTLEDAYQFVMDNFISMNKLWVRIQHLPGEGKSKEQRKRRERERNELRILVGTNLVRLSQMEGIDSQIYGQVILPKILDTIVTCGDPLAQAYLMDCIIQVFPDEFHIETLDVLLAVCPKLRDKVNIRTILQSLMDRLANYYAEEELLDETDTNQVKLSLAKDSFVRFEGCVQNVYNARGPKLTPKEVIRLQTALLNFSLKCYPGNMEQVNRCLGVCVTALHQARTGIPEEGTSLAPKALDEVAVTELGKLLSIPLDSLALKVLELDHYSDLLAQLPWGNRRELSVSMLKSVTASNQSPRTVREVDELFLIIAPIIRDENMAPPPTDTHVDRTSDLMKDLGITARHSMSFGQGEPGIESMGGSPEENALVSKLIHLLSHEDLDIAYKMLSVARNHLGTGGKGRIGNTMVPLVFASLQLVDRLYPLEYPLPVSEQLEEEMEEDGITKQDEPVEPEGTEEIASEPVGDSATSENPEEMLTDGDLKTDTVGLDSTEEASDGGDPPASAGCTTEETKHRSEAGGTVSDLVVPEKPPERTVSCHKVFVFLQKTIAMLSAGNAETGVKLYLQTAVAADRLALPESKEEFAPIAYELIAQAFVLYEEQISDSKAQQRCIVSMIGTLLSCRTLSREEYESLITKVAQYSAKLLKKPDQCRLVTQCSHLFFTTENEGTFVYREPQRALECLQRALKLADASTTLAPSNVVLFVDLLDHYVSHFEHGNPSITDKYVTGLIALITEHLNSVSPLTGGDTSTIAEARAQFDEILAYIRRKKDEPGSAAKFGSIPSDRK